MEPICYGQLRKNFARNRGQVKEKALKRTADRISLERMGRGEVRNDPVQYQQHEEHQHDPVHQAAHHAHCQQDAYDHGHQQQEHLPLRIVDSEIHHRRAKTVIDPAEPRMMNAIQIKSPAAKHKIMLFRFGRAAATSKSSRNPNHLKAGCTQARRPFERFQIPQVRKQSKTNLNEETI